LSKTYPDITESIPTYIQQITIDNFKNVDVIIDDVLTKYNITDLQIKQFLQENIAIIKKFINQKLELCKNNKFIGIENNIIEHARILIAEKRTINIGDKLSGRHGNKGVVSYICPEVDMPFMENGTTIDLLLNPISIPNRLNIGQVLETQLGLSSMLLQDRVKVYIKANNPEKATDIINKYLEYNIHRDKSLNAEKIIAKSIDNKFVKLEAPSFNAITMEKITEILELLEHEDNGVFRLKNGITGEYYNRKIKVAPKYIMKLNHMAKDKLTARETGGYSAILQQPLPRKSRHGGQRFGEMEAWASESYGATVFLRETLGPRSDDRKARNLMYEWILSRKYKFISHLCETVNVIIRYLNGGCLMLDFKKKIKKIK
jgi:DNA-directed RNA polymerase subunit beta